jgi:hypothetical protein
VKKIKAAHTGFHVLGIAARTVIRLVLLGEYGNPDYALYNPEE